MRTIVPLKWTRSGVLARDENDASKWNQTRHSNGQLTHSFACSHHVVHETAAKNELSGRIGLNTWDERLCGVIQR